MIQEQALRILIALSDRGTSRQIAEKVREALQGVPLSIVIVDDGQRAVDEFNQKGADLIFVGSGLPSLGGSEIVNEIRKSDGSVAVFFLHSKDKEIPEEVEGVRLPISDWTEFLNRVQFSIPESWKMQFGLFQRKGPLFQQLVEYGKRYRPNKDDHQSPALVCIPKIYDSSELVSLKTQDSLLPQVTFRQLDPGQQKYIMRFEVLILGALTLTTLSIFYFIKDENSQFYFARNLMLILAGVSYLGFFLGRVFDRFFLSRITKS